MFAAQSESGNHECFISVRDAARDFSDLPDPQDGEAITLDERGSPITLVLVNVYPSAAQSDKSNAYALNPSRLTSLSPCKDARILISHLSK